MNKDEKDNIINNELFKYKEYFDNIFKGIDNSISLDLEQRNAILTDEKNVMVIAGAGSGKTTTMAAKVKFLVDIKKINPNDIIMISFTNKAVNELRDKINKEFNIPINICTFHKFGLDIIRKKDNKIKILNDKYEVIGCYINNILSKDMVKLKKLLDYYVYYFDIPTFAMKFKNINEYKYFLSYKKYFSIKGKIEYLKNKNFNNNKSIQSEQMDNCEEVMVANFLYLNGINYEYRKCYLNNYFPDFTINYNDKVICIEILNTNKNLHNTFEKIKMRKKIIKIRKIHRKYKSKLIILECNENILKNLKKALKENGIKLNPINSMKIYNDILNENTEYYHKFILLCDTFIKGFKTNNFEDFNKFNRNIRINTFLEFMEDLYKYYQEYLKENNLIDFEDMVNIASDYVDKKLNYKSNIIDEYQDISLQRFKLIKKMSEICGSNLIVVGDDWQAIFAFAGSNVSLFTQFESLMGKSKLLKITNTYRNRQELIDLAGNFVMKNKNQIKKQLLSNKRICNPINIVYYENKLKELNKIIDRIVLEYGLNKSVLLIGRYNFDKKFFLNKGYFELDNGRLKSEKYPTLKLFFLTAHASKGLGFDNVIIVNSETGIYGFPSMVCTDEILKLVEVEPDDFYLSEERRLFYVALTRTKNEVYILSPYYESTFVKELLSKNGVITINKKRKLVSDVCPKCGYILRKKYSKLIDNLFICTNEKELCGFKTNNLEVKKEIKKCTCGGYLVVKEKNGKYFMGCTNFKTKKCTITKNI